MPLLYPIGLSSARKILLPEPLPERRYDNFLECVRKGFRTREAVVHNESGVADLAGVGRLLFHYDAPLSAAGKRLACLCAFGANTTRTWRLSST
jgi:hypothetical protein